jgi:hypothetical protein
MEAVEHSSRSYPNLTRAVLHMRVIRTYQTLPLVSKRSVAFETVVPVDGVRAASAGAPLALRMKVYLTRGRLDRQLAAGHAHDAAVELALRAKHLTNPRTQRDLARNLRGIVRYVDRHDARKGISCVVISPPAVRAGRTAICELAEQLERAAPVNPRGIVLAQALLTDGHSPLFNPYSEQTVAEATREIQDALEADPTIGYDVATGDAPS